MLNTFLRNVWLRLRRRIFSQMGPTASAETLQSQPTGATTPTTASTQPAPTAAAESIAATTQAALTAASANITVTAQPAPTAASANITATAQPAPTAAAVESIAAITHPALTAASANITATAQPAPTAAAGNTTETTAPIQPLLAASTARTTSDQGATAAHVKLVKKAWRLIARGRLERCLRLLDSAHLTATQARHAHNQTRLMEFYLRTVQILVYESLLREARRTTITTADGLFLSLDRRESYLTLYWKIAAQGRRFSFYDFELAHLEKIVIRDRYRPFIKELVLRVMQLDDYSKTTPDGMPLVNIILLAGISITRPDEYINLLEIYLTSHQVEEAAGLICPWTGLTPLDLANQACLRLEAVQLQEAGFQPARPTVPTRALVELTTRRSFSRLPPDPADDFRFRSALRQILESPEEFLTELKRHIEPEREPISQTILRWLTQSIETEDPQRPTMKILLSGSVAENTKIRPMDELDVVVQCSLDVQVEMTDEHQSYGILLSLLGRIEAELICVSDKNPFRYIGHLTLQRPYDGLGRAGEVLKPEVFSNYMEQYIRNSLRELPSYLMWDSPMISLTRPGLVLHLVYSRHGIATRVNVDIVSVVKLPTLRKIIRGMGLPSFDPRKHRFLRDRFSTCDGVLAKRVSDVRGQAVWRLSFSGCEKRLIKEQKCLYQTLKYLNHLAGQQVERTYYLKEVYCAYIVHRLMKKQRLAESLLDSLREICVYALNHQISLPFLCTKLGSNLERHCNQLFTRISEELGPPPPSPSRLSCFLQNSCLFGDQFRLNCENRNEVL